VNIKIFLKCNFGVDVEYNSCLTNTETTTLVKF